MHFLNVLSWALMASPRPPLISFGFPCDVAGTGANGRAHCQPRLQLLLGNHPEDDRKNPGALLATGMDSNSCRALTKPSCTQS